MLSAPDVDLFQRSVWMESTSGCSPGTRARLTVSAWRSLPPRIQVEADCDPDSELRIVDTYCRDQIDALYCVAYRWVANAWYLADDDSAYRKKVLRDGYNAILSSP